MKKSIAKTKSEIQKEYERRSNFAAKKKYDAKNLIRISIPLVKTTEQDIIDRLASVPNKSGYIKRLIREDIAKTK